jgi:hypothetical protein
MTKNIYTFYMPGEERIFLNYFHGITFGFLLLFSLLGVFITKLSPADAVFNALVFVLPFYGMIMIFKKRFADEVTLDFDLRKIRFVFRDERGTIEREFSEIKKVNFGFYLTFVMEDAGIMVKRPDNKKEIFYMLKSVFTVDRGILSIN